jgi:hypothetical protein
VNVVPRPHAESKYGVLLEDLGDLLRTDAQTPTNDVDFQPAR